MPLLLIPSWAVAIDPFLWPSQLILLFPAHQHQEFESRLTASVRYPAPTYYCDYVYIARAQEGINSKAIHFLYIYIYVYIYIYIIQS